MSLRDERLAAAFFQASVAQWIVDPRPIYNLLREKELYTPVDIENYANQHDGFIAAIRQRINIVEVNAAAAKLFGVADAEKFRQVVLNASRTQDTLNLCYAMLEIDKGGRSIFYQSDFHLPDNSNKSIWLSCVIPSHDDMDKGVHISAIDVSKYRQAELELAEREQFLAAILKAVPDILMVYDFERKEQIFQNSDITRVLGYSRQDMEDTKNNLLDYITHPEDMLTNNTLEEMRNVLEKDEVFETILRLQHNNGEWHYFLFRSAALDRKPDGKVINAVVISKDITEVLKAEKILTTQQRRLKLLTENISDVIITTDTFLGVNYVSPSIQTVLGYRPEEFLQSGKMIHVLGLKPHIPHLAAQLAESSIKVENRGWQDFEDVVEIEAIAADESIVPLELKISILRDEHQLLEGIMIVARDITERQRIEAGQRMAAKVFENSIEGIYITDASGRIVQVNKAFKEITGYRSDAIIGAKPSLLGAGWHETSFKKDILPVLEEKGVWNGELLSRRANGEAFLVWMSISAVTDSRGKCLGFITSFRDITEAKNSEESIRRLAYYDPLTDLPNRQLFHDRLSQAVQRATRNRHYVSLLFLDLDGFKPVNDEHGHAIGDRMLTEVAKRLKDCIRSDDTVARMGGDEFIIIVAALKDRMAAESASIQIANKVTNRLSEPFLIEGLELHVGASVGIALYPDDSNNAETLIEMADTAMYHAKSAGKGTYKFYTDDMHQRAEKRQMIGRDLHDALLNNEFILVYQPQHQMQDRRVCGFEALLRWQHPEAGLIAPGAFMRSVEDMGLGSRIGKWVLESACKQLKEWDDASHNHLTMSVNVFAQHYRDGDLVRNVRSSLQHYGIAPERLTLEFAENMVMKDVGYSYTVLSELRELGVGLTLDNFASGQLSLQYLSRLPIDAIKIDRQQILYIDKDDEQLRIVQAIMSIGDILGYKVLIEGIERETQLDKLFLSECKSLQGYLFHNPLLLDEVDAYLTQYKPKHSKSRVKN